MKSNQNDLKQVQKSAAYEPDINCLR